MCFAPDGQDEAIFHLKLCLRVFSLSGPKDDGRKVDEDADEDMSDDLRNQTDF